MHPSDTVTGVLTRHQHLQCLLNTYKGCNTGMRQEGVTTTEAELLLTLALLSLVRIYLQQRLVINAEYELTSKYKYM